MAACARPPSRHGTIHLGRRMSYLGLIISSRGPGGPGPWMESVTRLNGGGDFGESGIPEATVFVAGLDCGSDKISRWDRTSPPSMRHLQSARLTVTWQGWSVQQPPCQGSLRMHRESEATVLDGTQYLRKAPCHCTHVTRIQTAVVGARNVAHQARSPAVWGA